MAGLHRRVPRRMVACISQRRPQKPGDKRWLALLADSGSLEIGRVLVATRSRRSAVSVRALRYWLAVRSEVRVTLRFGDPFQDHVDELLVSTEWIAHAYFDFGIAAGDLSHQSRNVV